MGRRIAGLIAVGAAAVSMLGFAGTAAALANTTPAEEKATAFLEENMARFEVPQELRASLLAKALSGATLDAQLPGAVPTSTDDVTNELGTFPVKRYPDGSFDSLGVSTEVTDADGGTSLRAIKNCKMSGGAGGSAYRGCQVYHWTAWHNMHFDANYSRASNAGSITYIGGRGWDSGNSCTTEEFKISKKVGNNGNPAKADWLMACTDISGASSSKYLGLRVSGTSAHSVQDY
ncbi:hypothetical protein [Microbacterium sp. MM2322]|uniref:hypothetical protein n=1 Tax=Microbacterium sp. MM2322 TaxID=3157631 RepID=UPI0032D5A4D7